METTIEKTFALDASKIQAVNLGFRVKAARMERPEDNYETGQSLDGHPQEAEFDGRKIHKRLRDAFADIWSNLPKVGPEGQHIRTIDNSIYCDTKSGETRVVDDRGARGVYRVTFDRLETKRGYDPAPAVCEQWKKGEVKLYCGRYEIEFEIVIVGLNETELADVCGVNKSSLT